MQNNLNNKISKIIKLSLSKLAKIDINYINDNSHFVKEKVIDSLDVMTLILDLEKKLNISFDEDDFMNEEFMTVEGLTNIISEKIDKTNALK